MICVSLGRTSPEKIEHLAGEADLVEIRIDLNRFSPDEIKKIFATSPNLIATFRPGMLDDTVRLSSLLLAKRSGAAFIDLDLDKDRWMLKKIIREPGPSGFKLILSYHNFYLTPKRHELEKIASELFSAGADIAKIACMVKCRSDIFPLLSLYETHRNIIPIGMGVEGRITRLAACFLGAPFTYAGQGNEKTEVGQIDHMLLRDIVADLKNG